MRLAILAALLALAAAAQVDPLQTGPTTLVITYKCLPGERVFFRQRVTETALNRLQHWQEEHLLADYHVLFSRYVDTNNWDMMLILMFSDYTRVAQWKRIENNFPGGLPPDALSHTIAVSSYPADHVRWNATEPGQNDPVYMIIPYSYSVPTPEYLQYVDTYVRPQFEGWLKEGVLTSYDIFLQRYPPSRPWDSLIVLKYKDDESLGLRESVVAKVRARLRDNPEWKAASDNKHNIRTEREPIIADELAHPR